MCYFTMEKQTEDINKNINYDFKLLYAFAIIMVVMGHCTCRGGFSLFTEFFPVYSFLMGLFVFASGYFYNSDNEDNVIAFIRKKTKKLIIPLYLWNIFYGGFVLIIQNYGFLSDVHVNMQNLFVDPIKNGQEFKLNGGSWFIFPLFMTHILNIIVRKILRTLKIKINEFVYFSISLAVGIAGIMLAQKGYHNGWYMPIVKIAYFIPFYSLGILYKKYEKYDKLDNLLYFSILISIALIMIYKYGSMPIVQPSWGNFNTSNAVIPFISGALGTAFWLRMSKILSPAIGKSKYTTLLADNTYSIMINHVLGFQIINSIFAMIHNYTGLCRNFNMEIFKSLSSYYCYLPKSISQLAIVYLFGAIFISIIIQKLILKIYAKLRNISVI